MAALSHNWLTDKHIDFEYKKYELLAYLQEVNQSYGQTKIFPWLGDLLNQYKDLTLFKENQQKLKEHFSKDFTGIDPTTLTLKYNVLSDEKDLEEVNSILNFAIPLLKNSIDEGKRIFDFVESHITFSPIGIVPLYNKEGYLFLNVTSQLHVYKYGVLFYQNSSDHLRSLSTEYVTSYETSTAIYPEKIKSLLIKDYPELPNPAVYSIHSDLDIPFNETLLPIAKRYFVTRIAA